MDFEMSDLSTEQRYSQLHSQLSALVEGPLHAVGVLANASALLREVMGERFFWVGFYLVEGDRLLLGPFQGSVACYSIARGRGVCGAAWERRATVVVPDVEQFPGHIACSSLSRSEIVVPLLDAAGKVRGVLDVDSTEPGAFTEADRQGLEQAAKIIARAIFAGDISTVDCP